MENKLLQMTGTVNQRQMKDQFLDNMDLERERGITIKLQAARMRYVLDNQPYCLNLIDTPGHVDFSYEVSRSLAACEGALLVIDASQGVEAQTLANVYLALENNLEIIPVLNKIDLPGAEPSRVMQEIEEVIGLDCSDAIHCSAKEGIGIADILNAIVKKVPPPKDTADRPLRALIFDSYYDSYRGVIVYFRVIDGTIKKGDRIYFMASKKVGYLSASIRSVADARVGDTITHFGRRAEISLPGYEEATPMVFCGLFPVDSDQYALLSATVDHVFASISYKTCTILFDFDIHVLARYPELRDALEKLQLNDAALNKWHKRKNEESRIHSVGGKQMNEELEVEENSLSRGLRFEPETSSAMGFGFRCGFLGLLHMEIVQERLEREYNLTLITTAPSVVYRVNCVNGDTVECSNPSMLPEPDRRKSIEEPYVKIEMLTPKEYIGSLMELAQDRRGDFKEMKYITENRASLFYKLPLAEMVGDFFDQLKSRSKGYASMEYSFTEYRETDLIKLDIRINGDPVEPLSTIVHRDKAYSVGRALTQKLKELIPRQMFKIPIQPQ
ncbi:hypothetical protein ACLOJK_013855 [Asimina triloba]